MSRFFAINSFRRGTGKSGQTLMSQFFIVKSFSSGTSWFRKWTGKSGQTLLPRFFKIETFKIGTGQSGRVFRDTFAPIFPNTDLQDKDWTKWSGL